MIVNLQKSIIDTREKSKSIDSGINDLKQVSLIDFKSIFRLLPIRKHGKFGKNKNPSQLLKDALRRYLISLIFQKKLNFNKLNIIYMRFNPNNEKII